MRSRDHGLIDASARGLWRALCRLPRDWQAERARAELRVLNDRTLADIGLTRPQIESLYR